jgi:predicted  nucleic acid-binding Zn-ribbon protein
MCSCLIISNPLNDELEQKNQEIFELQEKLAQKEAEFDELSSNLSLAKQSIDKIKKMKGEHDATIRK